jgi:valyl-tRNA synthetase
VQGRDIVLSEERIEGYKHFCNKLWNATRFILLNKEGMRPSSVSARSIFDAWILTHLDELIEGVTSAMEELRFSDACTLLYDFFWHTFCDWYIESAKPRLEGEDRECVQNILSHVMKAFLRLLHPFMPYITEELWERMGGAESVLLASWPTASGYKDESACKKVEVLMEVVQRIRRLRLHLKIAPKKALRVWMKSAPSYTSLLTKESWFIKSLANLKEFSVAEDTRRPSPSLMETARAGQLYLLIDEKVQVQKERERVGSRLKSLEQQMERIKRRLSSEEFLKKAAPSFIKEQRMRLRDLKKEYNLLLEDFESLHE